MTGAATPSGAAAPVLAVHASALVLGETGILIRGPSGAGKSALVLALLEAAAGRCLFARLVADDRVRLMVSGERLLAAPHPAIAGQIEDRGRGIFPLAHESCARIGYVVDLVAADRAADIPARLPDDADLNTIVADITLKRIVIPTDMPSETAARRILTIFTNG